MGNIRVKAIILIVVALVSIISGCGTGNQITMQKNQTDIPLIIKHFRLNKEFQIGNQTLLISNIFTTRKIERTSYITKQTNNLFLVMRIRVTNNGSQTCYYEPNLFNVKNRAGLIFPCSDESDFYLNNHAYFFFKPVSPDETHIGDIFFEIPAKENELIFEASNCLDDKEKLQLDLASVLADPHEKAGF